MASPDRKIFEIDYLGLIEKNPWLIGIVAEALIVTSDIKFMSGIQGKGNLDSSILHVNGHEGGAVFTPNHLSMYDFGLFLALRKLINPDIPFGVPWANKFTGKDSGLYEDENEDEENILLGKIGEVLAKRRQVELVSLPQESNNENSRDAVVALVGIRKNHLEKGGVTGIFVEGTRSRDGNLKLAKQGINRLFGSKEVRKRTIISPVALSGTNEVLPIGSKKVHLKPKVEAIFGNPYGYDQAKYEMEKYDLSLAEVVMLHIAKLLPREKWGAYKELFSKIM